MIKIKDVVNPSREPHFIFNECELDGVTLGLADYKASIKGTEATITIDSLRTDKMIVSDLNLGYDTLIDELNAFVLSLCEQEIELEKGTIDNVDEKLLEDVKPLSPVSILEQYAKQGYVRGAIMRIEQDFVTSYGIISDVVDTNVHADANIICKFTNHREVEAVHVWPVDDVNKEIIRMVEAEKGRIMEEAHQFTILIDTNIDKVIFD